MKKFFLLFAIILKSYWGFSQWQQTNGPTEGLVTCLAASGNTIFAGTSYGGGIFASNDNGTSWTNSSSGLNNNNNVTALTVMGNNIFAATSAGIYLSTNNGTSWTVCGSGTITYYPFNSLVTQGGYIWAGGSDGLFLSTDNGKSWTGSAGSTAYTPFYSLTTQGGNILAGGRDGILTFFNSGNNWNSFGLAHNLVYSLLPTYGSEIYAGTNQGVYSYSGTDTLWTSLCDAVLTSSNSIYSLAISQNNILAGADSGIYLSTDNGVSWTFNGLTNLEVRSLLVIGKEIFAGTDQGVWINQSILGIKEINGAKSYSINPNPCNTCKVIGEVNSNDLIITDIIGRNCFASFTKISDGYQINFGNKGSGIYFIKNIKTGEVGKFVKE